MKRLLTVLAGTILTQMWVMSAPAQEAWDAAFEASPANNDAAAQGAKKIRDTRIETRNRIEIEHIIGVNDGLSDDNGLHRLGSARCFMQDAAPTVLADGLSDYDNTTGGGETDLDNSSSNSAAGAFDDVGAARCWIDLDGADGVANEDCTGAGTDDGTGIPATGGTNTCCTAADTGSCDDDDMKLFVYVGVAGDAGVCPVTGECGWQASKSEITPADTTVTPGTRVKAGGSSGNLATNGDFEWDGCVTPDPTTTPPSQWTNVATETIDYVADPLGTGLQGEGCQVEVTAVANGDGITQVIAGLKANTTYRVTAQVLETGADECELTTTGALTEIAAGAMTSVDNTAFAQLDSFFVTAAAAIDSVQINLLNSAAGDICTWDHIAVYRQEDVEVPEAGIVAIKDTFVLSEFLNSSCANALDPQPCCTGAGTGTCEIDGVTHNAGTWVDVPELSITWVPPTEGWMVNVGGTLSIGCDGGCGAAGASDGVLCRLEKDNAAVTGTTVGEVSNIDAGGASDIIFRFEFQTIELNPTAGTSTTYTLACTESGTIPDAPGRFLYNPTDATPSATSSQLWMIAYPPL